MVALHSKHKQDKLAGSSVSPKMYEVYCNHADKDHIITKNWENVVQSKWTNCTRTWNGTSSSRTNMANRDVPRFSRPWHHGPQAQWEQERGPARGPVLQVGGLPLPQLDLAQAGQRSLHGTSVLLEGEHANHTGLDLSLLNRCSLFYVTREVWLGTLRCRCRGKNKYFCIHILNTYTVCIQ